MLKTSREPCHGSNARYSAPACVLQVEVVPSASSLVIKALNEPIRDRKKGPKNSERA